VHLRAEERHRGAQDASTQIRFARFPALSPDGRTLASSWRGDIWTAPVDGGTPPLVRLAHEMMRGK
jgi:hypothetical protein